MAIVWLDSTACQAKTRRVRSTHHFIRCVERTLQNRKQPRVVFGGGTDIGLIEHALDNCQRIGPGRDQRGAIFRGDAANGTMGIFSSARAARSSSGVAGTACGLVRDGKKRPKAT